MPEKIKRLSGMIIMLAVVIFCGQSIAGEFTADLVINIPGQNDTLNLYVKGKAYRLEKLEGKNKMLLFRKQGTTTALNPDVKEYKILDASEENMFNPIAAWENMSNDMEAKAGDNETINGYECRKYLYNYKGSDDVVFERWLSQALTFVVKQKILSSGGDAIMELTNIKEEPVDDALFEIPAGYTEAVNPEDLPVPIPDWAKDLESTPVMAPPFEKSMAAGETIRIKTEPGKSIWLRGKSTTDAEASAQAIPFKDGRPLKEVSMYNNFAMKGTICERRHEPAAEADYVVVHVEDGEVNVEAKLADMQEKDVSAGGEFRVPISGIHNIEMRLVNLIDGESEVSWDMLKNGEVLNPDYTKYRTKTFEKLNRSYKSTLSPDGDEIVFKVDKGEVLVKLGQFDTFTF